MSTYRVTEKTAHYEIGIDEDASGGVILAACVCGAGDLWPNKGLGRASAAAWKTRHQHTTGSGEALAWLRSESVAGIAGAAGMSLKTLVRQVASIHHPDRGGDRATWDRYEQAVQLLRKDGLL